MTDHTELHMKIEKMLVKFMVENENFIEEYLQDSVIILNSKYHLEITVTRYIGYISIRTEITKYGEGIDKRLCSIHSIAHEQYEHFKHPSKVLRYLSFLISYAFERKIKDLKNEEK